MIDPKRLMRRGVTPSCVVVPADARLRTHASDGTVLDFFLARFGHIHRDEWRARFASHSIFFVDRGQRMISLTGYEPLFSFAGMPIFYFRSNADEAKHEGEIHVVYRDRHLIVADKPHGLPVVPSGDYVSETLLARLREQFDLPTLTPIHRIDRDTAGLVVFCIEQETRGAYQSLFRERQVEKIYEAIAPYRDDLSLPMTYRSRLVDSDHFMQMKTVDGEANAETYIELIERIGTTHAKYRLSPMTGQRHQLRIQLATLGIPITNDAIYPILQSAPADASKAPLQLLAKSISFVDPITQHVHRFESQHELVWSEANS
ncbi:MAG: pseudouridine synthase [Casimicrobium sp.]